MWLLKGHEVAGWRIALARVASIRLVETLKGWMYNGVLLIVMTP